MVFDASEAKSGRSTCLHAAAIMMTVGRVKRVHDSAKGTINASLS